MSMHNKEPCNILDEAFCDNNQRFSIKMNTAVDKYPVTAAVKCRRPLTM